MRDARHLKLLSAPRGPAGVVAREPTLNAALAAIGWTALPASFGRRRIVDEAGDVLGDITASTLWAVLKAEGRVRP